MNPYSQLGFGDIGNDHHHSLYLSSLYLNRAALREFDSSFLPTKLEKNRMTQLNYREYQLKAHETAVYPADKAMLYLSTKLAGETGELLNHVGKTIRGDFTLQERHSEIEEELGGILWYVTEILTVMGAEAQDNQPFMVLAENDFGLFDFIPVSRDLFAFAASLIAGVDRHDVKHIMNMCTGMLGALDVLAALIGSNMETVAQRNLSLLAARAEKGTLKGHHREDEILTPNFGAMPLDMTALHEVVENLINPAPIVDTNDEAELSQSDITATMLIDPVSDDDDFDDYEDDFDDEIDYEDEATTI
jgi:NTP pyrophosphatase (non-canonical NTP hydrolase)